MKIRILDLSGIGAEAVKREMWLIEDNEEIQKAYEKAAQAPEELEAAQCFANVVDKFFGYQAAGILLPHRSRTLFEEILIDQLTDKGIFVFVREGGEFVCVQEQFKEQVFFNRGAHVEKKRLSTITQ